MIEVRIPYTIIVRLWRFYMGVTAFCWPLPFILVLLTYRLLRQCTALLIAIRSSVDLWRFA